MSGQLWPPFGEIHAHDMLRVYVGEFRSGARTNCQFSLCAVANRLPKRSATKLGSYPNPPVGVTFTGGPNVVPCDTQNGDAKTIISNVPAATAARRHRFEEVHMRCPPRGVWAEAEWPLRDAAIRGRVARVSSRAEN